MVRLLISRYLQMLLIENVRRSCKIKNQPKSYKGFDVAQDSYYVSDILMDYLCVKIGLIEH